MIEGKTKGQEIKAPEEPTQPKPAPDLMAALEETLANVREGRGARAERETEEKTKTR